MHFSRNVIYVSRVVNSASTGPLSLNVVRKRSKEKKLPCKREESAARLRWQKGT